MAIARLFGAQKRLFSRKKANSFRNLKSTRCLSSFASSAATTFGEKTSYSKKGESKEEPGAIAAEEFVKKYMEMNPGVFPTASHVHREVGGSWKIVKDILTEMKEKTMVDSQIQRTEDSQVSMQAASVKQDIDVEAASQATKMEENPDTTASKDMACVKQDIDVEAASEASKMEENLDNTASKDTAQLSEIMTHILIDQRSMSSEEPLKISEGVSNTAVKKEFPDIARLIEFQDGDLQVVKHSIKAMQHEKGKENKLLSMIRRLISDAGDRESVNGSDLNDAMSNKGKVVENRDKLSERKMTSLAQEQNFAPSTLPLSNEQTGMSLSYLFEDNQIEERSDKKMCTEHGAQRDDIASLNGSDLNDKISNKGKVVKNGDKLPERKMTSLAHNQNSPLSTLPISNEQTGIHLSYLFKDNQTEERSDKKMCVENGAQRKDIESLNGSDLNDEISHIGKVVRSGDKLPERNITSLTQEQYFPPTLPMSNEQTSISLSYLFKHNQTEERSHKKICVENGAQRNDIKSLNISDLNVAISNRWKVVKNGDKVPERKMTCPAQEQNFAPTLPMLNEQTGIGLSYLFKYNQTEERSDKKIWMENGAQRNDRVSNNSINDVNDGKKLLSLLSLIKDFDKTPPKNTSLNMHSPHSGVSRHSNSFGIMPDRLQHLNPNKEQKKLEGSNIHNEIEKPREIDKKVGKKEIRCSDFSVKEGNSSFSSMDQLHKVEEEAMIAFDEHDFQIANEDLSGNESDCAAVDYPMFESSAQIQHTQPTGCSIFLHTEKGRKRNHLMVKFLQKSATKDDVHVAFASCGPIAKISIVHSGKENWYNYAYVYFKTKEGLRKALSRTNTYVARSDVLVESVSPMPNGSNKICAPDLVDDPNFPSALLKNPTRIIMVRGLHQHLSSDCLRSALSFYGHISGFSMGYSADVAYVEFETEEAKEKALAASSISIFERQLHLYRIDVPQTTVVRISNFGKTPYQNVLHICGSLGQIKTAKCRDIDTVDVHFKTTEWARMVKILNSLNGKVVDGHRWIAQPGTVIPFDILQALWSELDGRQYVHSLIQDLSLRIGGFVNIDETTGLLREYYGGKS